MTRCARAAALSATTFVAGLVLGACAMVPPATDGGSTLSGRLAVHVDAIDGAAARSVSANFELQGDPDAGRLSLSSAFGSTLAQARWTRGSVVLATPQGERHFADLDALTREVLGESLPVAALFDWLRGRPWPGAPNTPNAAPTEPGFEQLGWIVSLAHFDEARIAARRERLPVVTVRAKLDRP